MANWGLILVCRKNLWKGKWIQNCWSPWFATYCFGKKPRLLCCNICTLLNFFDLIGSSYTGSFYQHFFTFIGSLMSSRTVKAIIWAWFVCHSGLRVAVAWQGPRNVANWLIDGVPSELLASSSSFRLVVQSFWEGSRYNCVGLLSI